MPFFAENEKCNSFDENVLPDENRGLGGMRKMIIIVNDDDEYEEEEENWVKNEENDLKNCE